MYLCHIGDSLYGYIAQTVYSGISLKVAKRESKPKSLYNIINTTVHFSMKLSFIGLKHLILMYRYVFL